MPRLLERLFGPAKPVRDYRRGPTLDGLDPITARAVALQRAYWQPSPTELDALEARGQDDLAPAELLRLHHLRCLALLDADDGALRRALLAPEDERSGSGVASGVASESEPGSEPGSEALARVRSSARALLGRRSPHRPRHGFAWLGQAVPETEAIPYSDFQGRAVNASLSHLGCVEVIRLDEAHEPASVDFLAFDEILTLARAPLAGADADPPKPLPPFVPARVLREYGRPELVVLLPLRYGLSWLSFEPAVVRGQRSHSVATLDLAGLADPTKAVGNPHDRRPLGLRVGPQRLEILSDYSEEGLGSFELGAAYQLSLAIDQDDPQFVAKCEGRGLDPTATRGDVVRESRLRASAQAARRSRTGEK